MGKLKYLVIHTTDTPFNREVTADDITLWHLGACKKSNGTYTYLGKTYRKSQLENELMTLPSGKKVPVLNTNGRGWKVTGYSDLIQRSGKLVNLNPYDFDDTVNQWELTNGASGFNSVSRHVVLAGGWTKDGKIKNGQKNGKYMKIDELYTKEQIQTLIEYVRMQLTGLESSGFKREDLQIVGHNDLSSKTCPNFKVNEFLKDYDVLNF